jgi:hypothetical protein
VGSGVITAVVAGAVNDFHDNDGGLHAVGVARSVEGTPRETPITVAPGRVTASRGVQGRDIGVAAERQMRHRHIAVSTAAISSRSMRR